MAHFEIRKAHTMNKSELRDIAQGLAEELEKDHGVRATWDGDCVRIRGAGVSGRLTLENEEVKVRVELGLLAAPFKVPLQNEVERYLDRYLR
ncbi:MAG: polyhydroxyalkanoic acid system family protein [Pseudomonadota bacterium]